MKVTLLGYVLGTLLSAERTRRTLRDARTDSNYVTEVHAVLTTVMLYHVTIVAIFCHLDPAIARHPWFSIVNTSLSILFSIGFYITDPRKKPLRYTLNFIYLFFASVLFGEMWLYFGNRDVVLGVLAVFAIFAVNAVAYARDRRALLGALYCFAIAVSVVSTSKVRPSLGYAVAINGAYALAVIAWLYLDHDVIANDKSRWHLEDALKYFYDVEGMVVRYLKPSN